MVLLQKALVEMGWTQPKSPIKCDNKNTVEVADENIIPQKTKSMDMQFHWILCRDPQGQLR